MRLDQLILVRLATAESLTPSALARQLRPLVTMDALKDFTKVLKAHIGPLTEGGWIQAGPLRITDRGRARAAEVLGVDALPEWRDVRGRLLPELALGLTIKKGADLKAAIVADLLVKQLGLSPRSKDPHEVINLAVTSTMKVPRTHARTLLTAVMRRWVAEESTATVVSPPTPPKPARVWTDDDVIAAVRAAIAQVPSAGRFGSDRVFVSAIWRQLDDGSTFPGLSLDRLKKLLLEANRRQQLTLARADLVGAMDQREVTASEIRDRTSTFHFVLDHSRS